MAETATIKTDKRFDFSSWSGFYEQVDQALANGTTQTIQLDLSQTQYLDSAALGMLVQTYKKCQSAGKSLKVVNAQGTARETLEIARIDKLISVN